MLKLVCLALLVAVAAADCGCEQTISALEKRIEFLESKMLGVLANSECGGRRRRRR